MNRTPDLDMQIELITPELAEKYLGNNVHNRRVRQRTINAYATDMREGRWELNGEAIRFDIRGDLADGQHRLLAVKESGASVPMVVIRGVGRSAQDTMDTGIPRKFADVLTLHGEENAALLAASVRSVWLWQRGIRAFGGSAGQATTPQLLDCLEHNPWIRDELSLIRRLSTYAKLPASISGALVFAFNEIDAEDAEFFFDRLTSDEGHKSGEPVFALRRTLLSSEDVRGSRNLRYLAAITCKAWNKYRAGEQCQVLKFKPGGAHAETFPEPK